MVTCITLIVSLAKSKSSTGRDGHQLMLKQSVLRDYLYNNLSCENLLNHNQHMGSE